MPETKSDRIAPVRKSIVVPWKPEAAFHRFTAEIGEWWPLSSHSVSESEDAGVAIEGRLGGRIVETAPDGARHHWGTVTAWDPPRRFAYLWHIRRDRADATDVTVTFEAGDAGRTRVSVVHDGWDRLGGDGASWRDANQGGWDGLLPHLVAACTQPHEEDQP